MAEINFKSKDQRRGRRKEEREEQKIGRRQISGRPEVGKKTRSVRPIKSNAALKELAVLHFKVVRDI